MHTEYCQAFDSNFRPIICILKNSTGTSAPHRPPEHHPVYPILYPDYNGPPHPDFDTDDDAECSCDTDCYPIITNSNDTGVNYRCRSCGSSCYVRGSRTRCSCATPSANSTCTCSATCAMFRHYSHYEDDDDSNEDSNCIFNVNLTDTRLGVEQRPYNCECCRSKSAQVTSEPDFVCICQRVARKSDLKRFEETVLIADKKSRHLIT